MFERTYALTADGRVEVDQRAGKVTVEGWDRPEVQVTATDYGDGEPPFDILAEDDRLRLVGRRGPLFGFSTRAIDLQLRVPRAVTLQIRSAAGRVSLRNLSGSASVDNAMGGVWAEEIGSLKVDVGAGEVRVRNAKGLIEAESGAGTVLVDGLEGALRAETGAGTITARRIRGPRLKAEAGLGTIELDEIDVDQVEVEGGAGGVKARLWIKPGGRYRFEAGLGNLEVAIPPESRCRVRLEADGLGSVRQELPLTEVYAEGKVVRGVLNAPDAQLELEGGLGGVRLVPWRGTPEREEAREPERAAPARPPGEEMKQVLKMVQEGRLSPEEAAEILQALEEKN